MVTPSLRTRVAVSGAVALLLTAGVAVSIAAPPSSYPRPGQTERVSVSSSGAQATYVGANFMASVVRSDVSADGRYVVFESDATNLDPSVTIKSATYQVYRHDRKTGQTRMVSLSSGGVPALGQSYEPTVSGDGRYVAFTSAAPNLVAGDTNAIPDVFRRDMLTGQTIRVSLASNGSQAAPTLAVPAWGGSHSPSISNDGQRVAFASEASNLAGTSGSTNVYVRDLPRQKTTLVSANSDGTPSGTASDPGISGNGRYVVFTARPGLAGQKTLNQYEVYLRDLATAKTRVVSVASDQTPATLDPNPECGAPPPAIITLPEPAGSLLGGEAVLPCVRSVTFGSGFGSVSDDGRFVVFQSNATNLVPNDGTCIPKPTTSALMGCYKNFVHDMLTGRTERIDVDSFGRPLQGNLEGEQRVISGNGRFVAYAHPGSSDQPASCSPLAGVSNTVGLPDVLSDLTSCHAADLHLYDRLAGAMESLTTSVSGGAATSGQCGLTGALVSSLGGLSTDGRFVSFNSSATNLVRNDTNDHCDVFLRDRGAALGVGGLAGIPGASSPSPGCGLPVCPPLPAGAGLQQARVIPRQGLQDLFIRWDVSRMAPVAGAPAGGLLYELRFTSGGQRYAVRAQRLAGTDFDSAGGASFGLFRQTSAGLWEKAASLRGGYGTIGDSVVTAVPLSLIGGKAQLTDVTASTAVGSYLSGPTKVLDSLRLSR